nr:hypothetical protein [Tanacetum cinerariifolium]
MVIDSNWFKDKMLLARKEEAWGILDDEEYAFDSDCDENLTTRAIFMAKLTPTGLVIDNDVGPFYDTDAMFEEPNPAFRRLLGIKCSKFATVEEFSLLHEDKIYSESKTREPNPAFRRLLGIKCSKDEEDETSRDDADDEDGDEDEDEEEEEHPAPTDSVPPHVHRVTARIANVPKVKLPPRKRFCIALGLRFEVGESSSAPTARPTRGFRADYGFVGTLEDNIRRDPERELNMLRRDRRDHARTATDSEVRLSREAWVQSMNASDIARAEKRKNDVKARTTLLVALPDEHQLRFSKYDSAKELWEAILKTFGANEATKKTKKNQLKQQYGNFKAEGSETLEQTFNRLQAIVSHLEFIDIPIEQDDLNQKFLTSLASEWLMYTIVWRNRDDLDTMSLDDVYNHLKVYEPEVQKRAGSNSQNMAFISSSNKKEIDIKWNLALLSMMADRFWKKTGKKITIQGSDIAGFEKSKVECFNCHKMGHFARECKSPRSQDRGKRESYKKDPNVEEPAPKEMIAIDGIGWDWSYMDEEDEDSKNHALVADEDEVPTEYALKVKSSSSLDNKMGLPEFVDDTITDYTRPTPSIDVSKSVSKEQEERWKSNNPSFFKQRGSSGNVVSKPMIKFMKESGYPNATKVNNTENTRKPTVKYEEMYRNTSQSLRVRGNQRNWNNQKS